jgi:transposase
VTDCELRLFVGVDWGSEKHQVCVLRPDRTIIAERSFGHSGEGLAELTQWLEELSGGKLEAVHVAIEVPQGAVVDTLRHHGCQVFSINPRQIDRFRDRHSVAGAKDDRRDAQVLADSLSTDPKSFRRISSEDSNVNELREWTRNLEDLKRERVRLVLKLRDQLNRYFPQALELTSDLEDRWFLVLLKKFSTPEAARRATIRSVSAILERHRIRKIEATKVLEILRKRPLFLMPGTVDGLAAQVKLTIERLEIANDQVRQSEQKLDTIVERMSSPSERDDEGNEQQRDVEILRSFPGVGRIVLATLLSEAPQAVRERDYHALRAFAGVAPVTTQSGKKCRVVMRHACNARVRDACYHWARVAAQQDPAIKSYYRQHRDLGKTHGHTHRLVADKLLAVACSMLRHGTLYDPLRSQGKVA